MIVTIFFAWASQDYKAEEMAYQAALKNKNVNLSVTQDYILISPKSGDNGTAYIFYPGAKVEPQAYLYKLAEIATNANVQIIITRPFLNLAVFGISEAGEIQAVFPKVKHWYIGGHSMGGSMACMFAGKHPEKFDGVLILGTYSETDLSRTSLRVMSINGDQDGIFPPKFIADKKAMLPVSARIVTVRGMNHAEVGNYGKQSGDAEPKTTDEEVLDIMKKVTKQFFNN